MQYSDSLYLSRFAVDPDLESFGLDNMEDFNFSEAPIIEKFDTELFPDTDIETDLA